MGPVDAKSRQLSALEPLELRHLPDEGVQFDETVPVAWIQARLGAETDAGQELTYPRDGTLSLTVTPLGPVDEHPPILVRGRIDGAARTACVRCLEDVDLSLAAEVEQTLFHRVPAKPETEAEDGKKGRKRGPKKKGKKSKELEDWSDQAMPDLEALDDGGYTDDEIDLPALLEEAYVLALDLNPTCADEPACDVRTQALLDAVNLPAQQMDAEPDPRWAALRELVGTDTEES